MVDVLNTFVAIILSVVALTPIFLLVTLLNRSKIPQGTDPAIIKQLEDMDKTIANDTNNALDQVARNSTSFVKDAVPLPGRNVGLSFRLTY